MRRVRSPSESVEVSIGKLIPSSFCRTSMYWPEVDSELLNCLASSGVVRQKLVNPIYVRSWLMNVIFLTNLAEL